jgi:hypothetical protein
MNFENRLDFEFSSFVILHYRKISFEDILTSGIDHYHCQRMNDYPLLHTLYCGIVDTWVMDEAYFLFCVSVQRRC